VILETAVFFVATRYNRRKASAIMENVTMKNVRIPLYEHLRNRWDHDHASFHVPGHKYGRQLPKEPFEWFRTIMRLDVTELADTDDLHHPEGIIREAQQLAARCYGADESYLLVGGSTSGNLAMILAVCARDDIVIVQRNIHKSIGNGLRLAGARPVFVRPQFDPCTGTPTIPSLADLEAVLAAYPQARAVILSTPNYYGVSVELAPYAALAHQYGMPLLIDEAHGAHYGFHPRFPRSAIRSGADAVVQSTHKTLTALTMGAMLHVQGDRIDRQAVKEALSVVQSSSPSYPIMASLDIARAMVESEGPRLFEGCLEAVDRFRTVFRDRGTSPLALVEHEEGSSVTGDPTPSYDPLRVLLYDRTGTWSGFELLDKLAERNCAPEMADERFVVLLFGIGTTEEDVARLLAAVSEISQELLCRLEEGSAEEKHAFPMPSDRTEELFEPFSSPFNLQRANWDDEQSERIPIEEAANRISAEMVVPYPPGIPLLYPGEPVLEAMIRKIRQLADKGVRYQGAADAAMKTIRVMRRQMKNGDRG
jgi:arginine decarboxylase